VPEASVLPVKGGRVIYDNACHRCGGIIPAVSLYPDHDGPISPTLCCRCYKIQEENARAARQGDGQARLLV
jgi:hypothetical protein